MLCTACDLAVHETKKLSRCHTRVPLNLIDTLGIHLPTTTNKSLIDVIQSRNKTSSAENGFDERDESSGLLIVPDTDEIQLAPQYNHHDIYPKPSPKEQPSWTQDMWSPTVPDTDQERLTSIAGAFVKKEAQTLFESSQRQSPDSDIGNGLEISWMKDTLPPVHNGGFSCTDAPRSFVEEQQVLPGTRFALPNDHAQRAINDILGSLPTTEDDSSILGTDSSTGLKSERASLDELERSDEQKRLDRQAALRRFRHKRANRSFQKKVRYACRKQLADSRPRVKGRFVGRAKTAHPSRILKSGATEMTG